MRPEGACRVLPARHAPPRGAHDRRHRYPACRHRARHARAPMPRSRAAAGARALPQAGAAPAVGDGTRGRVRCRAGGGQPRHRQAAGAVRGTDDAAAAGGAGGRAARRAVHAPPGGASAPLSGEQGARFVRGAAARSRALCRGRAELRRPGRHGVGRAPATARTAAAPGLVCDAARGGGVRAVGEPRDGPRRGCRGGAAPPLRRERAGGCRDALRHRHLRRPVQQPAGGALGPPAGCSTRR